MDGEKAWRQLHKNTTSNTEQNLKAAPHKATALRHQPHITKTITIRRKRYAGHCWRSRNELISDVLLWTPSHERAKAGRPARTNIHSSVSIRDISRKTCQKQWTRGRMVREGQGYLCWWRDMIMMMRYNILNNIFQECP